MTQRSMWRKVAEAFVDFEGQAPAPSSAPTDADLASASADAERLLRELEGAGSPPPITKASGAAPPPPPVTPARPSSGATPAVAEGAPFDDVYRRAEVPAVHHPAEQMLAILQGLAAMPPEARRMAIQAMDAADDRWTLEDVILDAQRKRAALSAVVGALQDTVRTAEADAQHAKAEADRLLTEAQSTIEQRIAELQAELASFKEQAAAQHAQADAALRNAQDSVTRETARYQAELARLGEIESFFLPHSPRS